MNGGLKKRFDLGCGALLYMLNVILSYYTFPPAPASGNRSRSTMSHEHVSCKKNTLNVLALVFLSPKTIYVNVAIVGPSTEPGPWI